MNLQGCLIEGLVTLSNDNHTYGLGDVDKPQHSQHHEDVSMFDTTSKRKAIEYQGTALTDSPR